MPPSLPGRLSRGPSTLSKPAYRVLFESNVRVAMRDGVTLASDIYRPDAPGKFPAILVRTPYNRATAGLTDEARWFAARGYVVVRQDVRGRYDSDGTFYAFKNEADDGYDADEWFGSQPWPALQRWLAAFESSEAYRGVMDKVPVWLEGQAQVYFSIL